MNWRRALLYIVAPALITGILSIAPKAYDEFRNSTRLSYVLISGPSIPWGYSFRRIFSVAIRNSGKAPLTNVLLLVQTADAQIDKVAVESSFLSPTASQTSRKFSIAIKRMLPGEELHSSLMISSSDSEAKLDLSARSDQVLGVIETSDGGQTGGTVAVVGALLAALSVAIMSAVMLRFVRNRVRYVMEGPGQKQDTIMLIAGLSGIIPSYDSLLLDKNVTTYFRLADLLLFAGLSGDAQVRARCIVGLKSILLIGGVTETSQTRIRENIRFLGVEYSNKAFENRYSADDPELRRKILQTFADA